MTRTLTLLLCFAVACGGNGKKDRPVQDVPVTAEPAPQPPPEEPKPEAGPTPEKLYALCEDRVEKPQVEAECTADSDCATSGCGGEVCTTVAAAVDVMTTCEGKLCFQILDSCGCHQGQCTWTLKDEVPKGHKIAPKPDGDAPGGSLPTGAPARGEAPKDH